MSYLVTTNTPGYLPESEPIEAATWDEALVVAGNEIDAICDGFGELGHEVKAVVVEEPYALWRLTDLWDDNDLGRVVEITASELATRRP
jgi:hypothetical protein